MLTKLLALLFLCACQPKQAEKSAQVLVTIAPYAYFVEKIAGNTVEIAELVPPGVNMHIFEPTPRELVRLSHTKLWLKLGEPFEERILTAFKEKNPGMEVLDLGKGIPLLAHQGCGEDHVHEEARDLHYWMSPKLALMQCQEIAAALIRLFPEHREQYEKGLKSLENELTNLDEELHTLLDPLKGRAILVSHSSFAYFCQEYGLIELSIECGGKEPLPRDIDALVKRAKELKVQAVFTQAGYANKGAELIAHMLHLPIHQVDPYNRDYSHNMMHIARLIAQ